MGHFVVYGVFGWCAEIVWTALYELIGGAAVDPEDPCHLVPLSPAARWRLSGRTYLWMFPLYGAGGLVFEPLHDVLRGAPWWLRGAIWTVLIFVVEYAGGALLRRVTGRCPWDYQYARWSVHGLIRLDYIPVWFCVGLLLERIHDNIARLSLA